MRAFKTIFKTELKLTLRHMDSFTFGILFPVCITVLLGLIYGDKPAYEGAPYTFVQQSFGALVSIGICATGLVGIPLNLANYRHLKVLKRYHMTPVRPVLLLMVQFLVQLSIALVSFASVSVIAILCFNYHMVGSVWGFLMYYLLVLITIYSIGFLVASVAPDIKTATVLCMIIYFPMMFLSGATVPYEIMPDIVQKGISILPMTHGIKLLKGVSLGIPVENMLFSNFFMLLVAAVCSTLSIKLFKWE